MGSHLKPMLRRAAFSMRLWYTLPLLLIAASLRCAAPGPQAESSGHGVIVQALLTATGEALRLRAIASTLSERRKSIPADFEERVHAMLTQLSMPHARIRVDIRDTPALTPTGADDYGYPGLKRVLDSRLLLIRSMRYAVQYRNLVVEGKRATLDLRYDLSYQIATDLGDRWERKQSDKRIELVNEGGRWLFLSGM